MTTHPLPRQTITGRPRKWVRVRSLAGVNLSDLTILGFKSPSGNDINAQASADTMLGWVGDWAKPLGHGKYATKDVSLREAITNPEQRIKLAIDQGPRSYSEAKAGNIWVELEETGEA